MNTEHKSSRLVQRVGAILAAFIAAGLFALPAAAQTAGTMMYPDPAQIYQEEATVTTLVIKNLGTVGAEDWVGLFRRTDPNTAKPLGTWKGYLQRGVPIKVAANKLPLGTYDFRLFRGAGCKNRGALSAPLKVVERELKGTVSTRGFTSAAPGGSVPVMYTISRPLPTDWIGLFRPGDPNTAPRSRVTVGKTSNTTPPPPRAANASVPVPSGTAPGDYELRLFSGGTHTGGTPLMLDVHGPIRIVPANRGRLLDSIHPAPDGVRYQMSSRFLDIGWENVAGAHVHDWIAIYPIGVEPTEGGEVELSEIQRTLLTYGAPDSALRLDGPRLGWPTKVGVYRIVLMSGSSRRMLLQGPVFHVVAANLPVIGISGGSWTGATYRLQPGVQLTVTWSYPARPWRSAVPGSNANMRPTGPSTFTPQAGDAGIVCLNYQTWQRAWDNKVCKSWYVPN